MASLESTQFIRATVTATVLTVAMASLFSYLRRASEQRSIYKLIYTVPPTHLAATKQAIFAAGGGTYENGKYKNTTFESQGVGVFTPDKNANPNIGQVGVEERCDEVRVEVRCEGIDVTKEAVKALLLAHPYETVGYEVFKAEDALMSIDKSELLKQKA